METHDADDDARVLEVTKSGSFRHDSAGNAGRIVNKAHE